MGKPMDFKKKMKYVRGIKAATRGTDYDTANYLTLALLIGVPLGLIATRQMPATVLGIVFLPLPVLYYLTLYRWHRENQRQMMSFNPSVKLSIVDGMLGLDDGKSRARFDLEGIRELGVFIPGKTVDSGHWWIVVLEGLEYMFPGNAEGLEDFLAYFRKDPVFDTYPIDRPDVKSGRWTIWEKEGAG